MHAFREAQLIVYVDPLCEGRHGKVSHSRGSHLPFPLPFEIHDDDYWRKEETTTTTTWKHVAPVCSGTPEQDRDPPKKKITCAIISLSQWDAMCEMR